MQFTTVRNLSKVLVQLDSSDMAEACWLPAAAPELPTAMQAYRTSSLLTLCSADLQKRLSPRHQQDGLLNSPHAIVIRATGQSHGQPNSFVARDARICHIMTAISLRGQVDA